MDTSTALKTLRLAPGASRSDILTAYARLARRYPLAQFPERHTLLLDAKQTLLNPEAVLKDILFSDRVDLPWLSALLSRSEGVDVQKMPIDQLLAELVRRPLRKAAESHATHDAITPSDVMERLLEELGPDALEELMRRLP